MKIDRGIISDMLLIDAASPTTGCGFPTDGHRSNLILLQRLGIQSNFFFYRVDGQFFAEASPLNCFCDLVRFDPAELEDGRHIVVCFVFGQVLVDPQCRSGVASGTERSHVNKPVVIKLPAKGLEVAGIEVFGQNPLRESICGEEHQQSTTPFNDAGMLFSYQHAV